jgi:hypothetical protein
MGLHIKEDIQFPPPPDETVIDEEDVGQLYFPLVEDIVIMEMSLLYSSVA